MAVRIKTDAGMAEVHIGRWLRDGNATPLPVGMNGLDARRVRKSESKFAPAGRQAR